MVPFRVNKGECTLWLRHLAIELFLPQCVTSLGFAYFLTSEYTYRLICNDNCFIKIFIKILHLYLANYLYSVITVRGILRFPVCQQISERSCGCSSQRNQQCNVHVSFITATRHQQEAHEIRCARMWMLRMCLESESMHVCCAGERTVCLMCAWMSSAWREPAPKRSACVHVCVLHECAFACLYVCGCPRIHTYAARRPSLFTLAAHKKHTCMLVVWRVLLCDVSAQPRRSFISWSPSFLFV